MKAAQFTNYGGPEVIEITEVPKPIPAENQVLIEVHAATINPFDYKVRRGNMKDSMPLNLPITLGGNLSGEIVAVGTNVTDFKIGDEVFGQSYAFGGGSGAIAEFAITNAANIALKAKTINYLEAGSLPLVGVSAVQALEQHINLPAAAKASAGKQKILIHGGAGGIGSIAIQLAKHLGAYVATTVSGDDIEFVKSLGANEVIDYTSEKFEEKLHDFDAVFDTVGGDTTDKSFKVLKPGGILVTMVGSSTLNAQSAGAINEFGIKVISQNTQTNAKNLTRLAELLDQGIIKPEVDKVFPLSETRDAFEYVETGHPRGKVVISIKK